MAAGQSPSGTSTRKEGRKKEKWLRHIVESHPEDLILRLLLSLPGDYLSSIFVVPRMDLSS